MKTAVYIKPEEVEYALARLDVPLNVLQKAVQSGLTGRINRTSNDASNAPGFYQWNDTVRSLREDMAALGWERNDEGNWPTTVHPEKRLAIAVSSGNVHTGNPDVQPSTKTAKGQKTMEAVAGNRQGWFPGFEPVPPEIADDRGYPIWHLLYNSNGKVLKAELSLATRMDKDGHINFWPKRIILPATPFNPDLKIPAPDFGPDVDIRITKKG